MLTAWDLSATRMQVCRDLFCFSQVYGIMFCCWCLLLFRLCFASVARERWDEAGKLKETGQKLLTSSTHMYSCIHLGLVLIRTHNYVAIGWALGLRKVSASGDHVIDHRLTVSNNISCLLETMKASKVYFTLMVLRKRTVSLISLLNSFYPAWLLLWSEWLHLSRWRLQLHKDADAVWWLSSRISFRIKAERSSGRSRPSWGKCHSFVSFFFQLCLHLHHTSLDSCLTLAFF